MDKRKTIDSVAQHNDNESGECNN